MKKIILSILLFFIFFEITSILFTKLNLFLVNETPKYSFEEKFKHDWIEKDENGIVWHKKNYTTRHVSRCFDVEYKTNNIGARDDDDYFKNDPRSAIMLIGDSFAEGPGVELEKIFAKVVESKINKKVLNFGNAGTEPISQYKKYKSDNIDYNFDELIYFFLPQNDWKSEKKEDHSIIENSEDKDNYKFQFSNFKYHIADLLARFTYSYNFIKSLYLVLDIKLNYGYENISYFIKDKELVDTTLNYIEKIINSKDKVKSYIVIIPTIYDIEIYKETNYKDLYWYKKIQLLSKKNNSTLIDLLDYIDYKKKHLYFHSCDGHWSEYGNIFASNIFLKIRKKNN